MLTFDKNGTAILDPDTLLVFMDETGEESFQDDQAPFFGFGGCLIENSQYYSELQEPWYGLKARFFQGKDVPLHATDLKPTIDQIEALNTFFSRPSFSRFAVTCGKSINIDSGLSIQSVEVIAANLWNRILETAKWKQNFKSITVIYETNTRLIPILQKNFTTYQISIDEDPIEVDYCNIRKSPHLAGLEIADFVAHTAGFHARRLESGSTKPDLSFNCVFTDRGEKVASYLHVEKVSLNK